jgi:3-oxoacyl-[acyl-carrier-protein] synthase II
VASLPLITGIGLATPLGNTCAATWQSLCAGNAIRDHARVPHIINAPGEARVNVLAVRVAREAIACARWRDDEIHSAALMVGTSKGPIDAWIATEKADECATAGGILPAFGLAETAACVAADLKIRGPAITLSAACASGLYALIRGAMLIRGGEASRVLVLAAESSLHPLFIASFRRLGVIAPEGYGCRPFDRTRAGFVVSEAAAAVCLEAAESEQTRARPWAAVERFAMGADAAHLTAGDPDGHILRHLLHRVIDGEPPDLIHAHGTATLANDPVELAAIEASLPERAGNPPSLYSQKGALGHSLGAAGLVAVVINCLSHRDGVVPPNVHTCEPLNTGVLQIHHGLRRRSIDCSIAIAAGFGGAVGAVTMKRVKSEK